MGMGQKAEAEKVLEPKSADRDLGLRGVSVEGYAGRASYDITMTVSRTASILWAQRLGYLLEHVGAAAKAVLLKEHVRKGARNSTKLLPGASADGAPRSKDWRLYVNASLEGRVADSPVERW